MFVKNVREELHFTLPGSAERERATYTHAQELQIEVVEAFALHEVVPEGRLQVQGVQRLHFTLKVEKIVTANKRFRVPVRSLFTVHREFRH